MEQLDRPAEGCLIDGLGSVDEWSAKVHEVLSKHTLAGEGVWTREAPYNLAAYLVLTIGSVNGEPVDPIVLDSSEGELTLSLGGWHTHLPEEALDAVGAVDEAVAYIDRWLSNDFRTLIFWKQDGAWAGSMALSKDETVQHIVEESDWLKRSSATTAELRTPTKSGWTYYANSDGSWVEVAVTERGSA